MSSKVFDFLLILALYFSGVNLLVHFIRGQYGHVTLWSPFVQRRGNVCAIFVEDIIYMTHFCQIIFNLGLYLRRSHKGISKLILVAILFKVIKVGAL